MSLPTEADFALVKIDAAIVCGLTGVTINQTAQSNDRYVRDCTAPGDVPVRKQRILGKALDITGTGLTNMPQVPTLMAALGVVTPYTVELYSKDGTSAGDLLGTVALSSAMTAFNMNVSQDNDATAEITLPSHGAWTWTAA